MSQTTQTSFSNVHVRVVDPATRSQVVAAVKAFVLGEGYEEITGSDADGEVDRTIFIEAGSRWIAVYDDDVSFGLARTLSSSSGGHAVQVLGSGPKIALRLFRAGDDRDALTLPVDDDGPRLAAHVDAWEEVLATSATGFDLWRAWRDTASSSDALAAMSPLVGWDLEAVATGADEIASDDARFVRLSFRSNSADSRTERSVPVRTRRPLHYDRRTGADGLEALQRPSRVFAVVAVDAEPSSLAPAVGDVFEDWFRLLAHGKTRHLDLETQSGHRAPEVRSHIVSGDLLEGEAWRREREAFSSLTAMHGIVSRATSGGSALIGDFVDGFMESFDPGRTGGFSAVFQPHLPPPITGDVLPIVGLWFDTLADEETNRELELAAGRLVDRLFQDNGGVQAAVGRWDWRPVPGTMDRTPYETACGIHGQITTMRAWCRRWLRAVTPTMWLGPTLLVHLADAPLDEVVDVAPVGTGVRLTLHEGTTLRALEQALAPCLPTEANWRGAVARFYR